MLFVCVSFTTTASFDAWGSEKSKKQGQGQPTKAPSPFPSEPAWLDTETAAAPGTSTERRTPNSVVDPNAPGWEDHQPVGDATPPHRDGGTTVEVTTDHCTVRDRSGICAGINVGGRVTVPLGDE